MPPGLVEWRPWRGSSVPCIFYDRELALNEARGALRQPLCKNWAEKNVSVSTIKAALDRLFFVIFERLIEKKEDKISQHSFVVIKNSDRAFALSTTADPIYCIGCAEKLMSGLKGSKNVIGTRVTMLGFISENSGAIAFGPRTSKGQKIHGVTMNESFLAILIKSTTMNLVCELEPRSNAIESLPDAPISRSDPTSFVYVFGWDPPTSENAEDLIRLSLERLVMDRVALLCDLYGGVGKVEVRPLTSKEENMASRASIHLLVMLMCWSPELCEWYVSAEDLLLSKRLAMLCDHEDMLITMEAARIRPEGEKTDLLDDAERMIREVQERRLRTALNYARKMGSLPDSLRELASKAVLVVNSKIKN